MILKIRQGQFGAVPLACLIVKVCMWYYNPLYYPYKVSMECCQVPRSVCNIGKVCTYNLCATVGDAGVPEDPSRCPGPASESCGSGGAPECRQGGDCSRQPQPSIRRAADSAFFHMLSSINTHSHVFLSFVYIIKSTFWMCLAKMWLIFAE